MNKLMIAVLKMVKKCKICKNKGSQGSPTPWDLTKKFARERGGIWQFLKICPGVARGG